MGRSPPDGRRSVLDVLTVLAALDRSDDAASGRPDLPAAVRAPPARTHRG
ncbi:hypothetical protein Svir_10980 [Saccharomonospora viridis DSM 43017]|uniref:Uncharacterized protein n=1 Tax=Saccharomonospora viridis (strain ATCC 15386 / DSM 43017 / JCM 3036 / CCUG 5913 / NBRC 12207 / NCIMB 9602 / P101) TaxID=471857 RepID=C7MZ33_SACVD|nr:hypothetical protein Svir_10980 [Saccharomonospora viridis DSM 43017]